MSTENVEVFNRYYGNGAATQFSIGFPYLKREFVKVYLYKKDTDEEKVLNSDQFSFVNDSIIQYPVLPTDEILKEGDIITIQRETELGSEFEFDNQRRLFPVEVMNADDLAFQQIQELSREINRAVRVNPTAAETPEELLQTVYDKLDSATEIAGDAISAANQAQTAADNATAAVNQAEQTLTEVTNYVDLAKTDIENTKNTAISTIDSTVAQAKTDINTAVSNAESNISTIVSDAEGSITNIVVTEANKAIANAAQEATDMATANLNSYVDGTVKPSLQTYVDQAQENANSAATSMQQAALSATAASNYANNASAEADNSAESAGLAANSAAAAAESEGKAAEYLQQVSDKITVIEGAVGDIGFAPLGIDETQNKRRYLNGQVISQTQFVSFTNKIKSAIELYPNLATTETNWQATVTNSKLGQCGKFVIDDTAGTIRLPKVVNINGLTDLSLMGGIKAESLPNITAGDLNTNKCLLAAIGATSSGAMITGAGSDNRFQIGGEAGQAVKAQIDASRSSSTYQDNAPVQQEAVQYPYFIQVATGVEETLPAIREYQINTPFFFGQSMYSDVAPDNASWLVSNGQWNAKSVYPDYYNWLLEQMNAGVSGFVASTAAYTDYDFVINTTDQTFRLPLLNGEEDLPGNTFENISYGGHNSSYTAPKNGSYTIFGYGATNFLFLNNSTSGERITTQGNTDANSSGGCTIKVKKGDVVTAGYYNGTVSYFVFTPAVGNGSLYYYVGDTVQDASLINAGAVLGQLSDKISRTAASDKELVVGWGMPDYTAGVSKAWNTNITAEKDGVVIANAGANQSTTLKATVNGNQLPYDEIANYGHLSISFMVSKGDVYKVYGANGTGTIVFYPLKGVN